MEKIIGETYLTEIHHEGEKISFQYPFFRGKYGQVGESIDKAGLKRPTSSETASLGYYAFQNPKGKTESEIIKILKNNCLWEFTGNYYLPEGKGDIQNGVILQENPKITNGKLDMDKEDLIARLYDAEEFRVNKHPIFISKDRSVRFVPFGYKTKILKVSELAKNPCVVARYLGRKNNELEGAEKIVKVASKYKKQPYLYSFDFVFEEKVGMSTLGGDCDFGGLDIGGGELYDDFSSYAFGLKPSPKD